MRKHRKELDLGWRERGAGKGNLAFWLLGRTLRR
jgi:hypothetical protein